MRTIEKIGLGFFYLVTNLVDNPKMWKHYRRFLWIMCLYVVVKTIIS